MPTTVSPRGAPEYVDQRAHLAGRPAMLVSLAQRRPFAQAVEALRSIDLSSRRSTATSLHTDACPTPCLRLAEMSGKATVRVIIDLWVRQNPRSQVVVPTPPGPTSHDALCRAEYSDLTGAQDQAANRAGEPASPQLIAAAARSYDLEFGFLITWRGVVRERLMSRAPESQGAVASCSG